MDDQKTALAEACLRAAETNSKTFPQIVGALMDADFEGYFVDFRRATATYYLPDGDSVELAADRGESAVAPSLNAAGLRSAIREAQACVPGYTYKRFCNKAAAAGCAAYFVSFSGRRVLYIGRAGETHVEFFPPD